MVDDLKDLKMVRLRGAEAKTWNDVYEALRITRNKNVEILQVLYIGETSGKILYNEACSSRLPGAVQIASPALLSSAIHATTLTIKRVSGEGVKVVVAHNHPSGDVTASGADKKMTTALAEYLKIKRVSFDGHIIINHNKYNVIDEEGNPDPRDLIDYPAEYEKDPLVTIPIPHEKLGKTLTRQDHVAAIAKDINRGKKYFTLLMRSGTRIRGIVNIELGVLGDSRQATSYIKDLMVNHGAQDAFVYREDFTQGQINTLVDLVQGNTLRDAAWEGEEKLTGLAEQGVFGDTNKQFGRDLEDYQGKWFEDYSSEFQEGEAEYGDETDAIISQAKKNGTYMKAPNGAESKLNPRQWAQVRTKAFKKWFGDWETAHTKAYLDGEPIHSITGKEFQKSDHSLVDKVADWFEQEFNGIATHPSLGDVILNRKGVRDSLAHGIGRTKAAAFAAVPKIIKDGRIIASETNWKGRGKDRFILAAPIDIGGESYVGIVVVQRAEDNQRFYLHEVGIKEKLRQSSKTAASADGTVELHGADDAVPLKNILLDIFSVNSENVSCQ